MGGRGRTAFVPPEPASLNAECHPVSCSLAGDGHPFSSSSIGWARGNPRAKFSFPTALCGTSRPRRCFLPFVSPCHRAFLFPSFMPLQLAFLPPKVPEHGGRRRG